MTQDELRSRIADYLDDLLDADEARAVEHEIARHPALLAEVARWRARLYRPYAVPPPASDLEQRILHRHRQRWWPRIVRYAAVFAAGVLTTLVVQRQPAARVAKDPAIEAPSVAPSETLIVRRRIR